MPIPALIKNSPYFVANCARDAATTLLTNKGRLNFIFRPTSDSEYDFVVSSLGQHLSVMHHAYKVNPVDQSVINANKEHMLSRVPTFPAPEECEWIEKQLETAHFSNLEKLILWYETNFPNSKQVLADAKNPATIMAQQGFAGLTGLQNRPQENTPSSNNPFGLGDDSPHP